MGQERKTFINGLLFMPEQNKYTDLKGQHNVILF